MTGGENMSFKVREFYYYAICFVTLIICIFAVAQLVDTIAEMFYPYPEYAPSKMELYQMKDRVNSDSVDSETLKQWVKEEQQLRMKREVQSRQHRFAKNLARSLAFLIIAIPLYIYHWRRVRSFEAN